MGCGPSVRYGSLSSRMGRPAQCAEGGMEREELWRSIIVILVLLALAVLVAQSRRNCEVPGSSLVPCIPFEAAWDWVRS